MSATLDAFKVHVTQSHYCRVIHTHQSGASALLLADDNTEAHKCCRRVGLAAVRKAPRLGVDGGVGRPSTHAECVLVQNAIYYHCCAQAREQIWPFALACLRATLWRRRCAIRRLHSWSTLRLRCVAWMHRCSVTSGGHAPPTVRDAIDEIRPAR